MVLVLQVPSRPLWLKKDGADLSFTPLDASKPWPESRSGETPLGHPRTRYLSAANNDAVQEMRHRWLPDDAELCIFGLPEDSLLEIPVVAATQQTAPGSPFLVRSRRGGKPRGPQQCLYYTSRQCAVL